jgi:predicted dehydrogenase
MLGAVDRAGVKHAYGSTSRYAPAMVYARQLLADGIIGQVREVESIARYNISPLLPYHWFHQVSQGGGLLNALFTHKLDQVLYATGGVVQAVTGEARQLIDRAPVGVVLHDFRELLDSRAAIPSGLAAAGEWKEVKADQAYTVIIRLRMPDNRTISSLFQASSMGVSAVPNCLTFYGTRGTLHLTGRNAPNLIQHYDLERKVWEDVPVTEEINKLYPQIADPVQRDWNQLVHEFVTHVSGEDYQGYPTFRDGLVAAEVMEIVRNGQGWTLMPESRIAR